MTSVGHQGQGVVVESDEKLNEKVPKLVLSLMKYWWAKYQNVFFSGCCIPFRRPKENDYRITSNLLLVLEPTFELLENSFTTYPITILSIKIIFFSFPDILLSSVFSTTVRCTWSTWSGPMCDTWKYSLDIFFLRLQLSALSSLRQRKSGGNKRLRGKSGKNWFEANFSQLLQKD